MTVATDGGIKMHREQLELLKRIQALEFTATEFNLYLDTHPGDQRAFIDFSNTVRELEQQKELYRRNYGPLIVDDTARQPCWNWIDDPWPWEIEY